MRSIRPALLLLLAALSLSAQTDAAKPASVAGVVKDSETGTPVPRAHVTLGRYGASAGADGKFLIDGLPAGPYPVNASKAGYAAPRRRSLIVLKPGETKTDFEIRMTPTGTIAGRITGSDGEPVESALVRAQANGVDLESGPADEHGMYRLGGLAPGRYRVKASRSDVLGGKPEIRTDGTAEHHDVTTYYPGVIAEEAAGTVVVRPGVESPGVDIQLARAPFVHVSGKVVGIPRGAENVMVTVSQGIEGNGIGIGNDGSFQFWRLDPGRYTISAEWTAPNGDHVETAGAEIEVADSNIENIELRPVEPSNIQGKLEFEDPSAKAMAMKDLQGLRVGLYQMSASANDQESGEVTAAGTFALRNVQAGKYWLSVADDKLYVKSMRLGSTAIDGALLDLSNGSAGADLTLVLSATTGVITGVVEDDRGNPEGTEVILVEAGVDTGFEPRRVKAGRDGAYTFRNIPPARTNSLRPEKRTLRRRGITSSATRIRWTA